MRVEHEEIMTEHSNGNQSTRGGVGRWVFWGFVLIAGYFLITEHRAHVIQFLPFLLVLACPLMHLLHRRGGHGDHGAEKKHSGGCH
jgi:hypothetical protein